MTHNDFFGEPLAIGDYVALMQPHYRNLVRGRVVGFTAKQVRLVWNNRVYPQRSIPDHEGILWGEEFLTYGETLVKAPADLYHRYSGGM